MRFTKSRWFAAISFAVFTPAWGTIEAAPPRYGGTLRVKLRAASVSVDPREWKPGSLAAADSEKLAALVYDRLVSLDDYGKFQPALATEWTHDASGRNWQFKLRAGVHFSDGSALTAGEAVAALQATLGRSFELGSVENGISIRAARPTPDLLEQLASGRNFVFRVPPDGTLLGTGPFFVTESAVAAPVEGNPAAFKAARIKFQANDNCWAGRPFV